MNVAYPDYLDWKEECRSFQGMAAYDLDDLPLTGDGEPVRLRTARVSIDFFSVLGVRPRLGRTFVSGEGSTDAPPVTLIGSGLWKRRFGADPAVVGRSITLGGHKRTVVGVMPDGFRFPDNVDLWLPETLTRAQTARDDYTHEVVARLESGLSPSDARRDIERITAGIAAEIEYKSNIGVTVTPLRTLYTRDVQSAVLLAFGGIILLVIITCTNIANLLLARYNTRRREVALRNALGAHPRHIVRQLLVESLVLAVFGGMVGLVLGVWGKDLLTAIIPIDVPFWVTFDIDTKVLFFTLGISLTTGVLFGLLPALESSRVDVAKVFKESQRAGMRGPGSHRLQNILVVAEVALALVLLISAGLLTQGLHNLYAVEPGYDTDQIISMRVALPPGEYDERVQRAQFFEQVLERFEANPEVVRAAAASNLPIGDETWGTSYTVEGAPPHAPGQVPVTYLSVITPGYLRTMGIELLRGQAFTPTDDRSADQWVAMVNESMVERWWSYEDPIGRRFKFGDVTSDLPWCTVIGVVRNVRQTSLRAESRENVYLPMQLVPQLQMNLVVRTEGDPLPLVNTLRRQIWEIAPCSP